MAILVTSSSRMVPTAVPVPSAITAFTALLRLTWNVSVPSETCVVGDVHRDLAACRDRLESRALPVASPLGRAVVLADARGGRGGDFAWVDVVHDDGLAAGAAQRHHEDGGTVGLEEFGRRRSRSWAGRRRRRWRPLPRRRRRWRWWVGRAGSGTSRRARTPRRRRCRCRCSTAVVPGGEGERARRGDVVVGWGRGVAGVTGRGGPRHRHGAAAGGVEA